MNLVFRTSAVLVLLFTLIGQANALDGYRDRRGLFYGIGLGGGQTKADIDGAESRLGYNLRFRIGGGIDQTTVLDAELGLGTAKYTTLGAEVEQTVTTIAVGGSKFINDGLYLRLQGGMTELSVEANGASDGETGLFIGGGGGYEFFANADLAIGLGVDFQHQMYDDFNVRAINLGITANWY